MLDKLFNLQFFAAGAGVLTNVLGARTDASGNTSYAVNSYTGDVATGDSTKSMADELKDYYDTELLENARVDMVYAQFARKQGLPEGHGGNVEWRKFNTFERAGKLTEGVIPTGQKFGVTKITDTIDQYGTYTTISDKLKLRAYDDIIQGATEEMGASAAETQEQLIRDDLLTGTNVLYCDKITKSDGSAAATTTQAALVDNATYHCRLTPTMVNKAVTKLKKAKVPKINGKYVAVVHPSVTFDIRQSDEWIEAHKYADTTPIFNGEIGELHGCRFIEDTFAPILNGDDLASDSRTLLINGAKSGAIAQVTFDGGTVAASALVGRKIIINGIAATVTANTTTTIDFASTNFGAIADNTVIYPGEGANEGVACYATFFFGKDGFAIIDPAGGALQMIVHDQDEIGGPLNQFSTIGYKFETNGAKILYQERVLRVMSTSTYSGSDTAN